MVFLICWKFAEWSILKTELPLALVLLVYTRKIAICRYLYHKYMYIYYIYYYIVCIIILYIIYIVCLYMYIYIYIYIYVFTYMYIFEKVRFIKVVSSHFLLVDYTNYNYIESCIIIHKFSWYHYTTLRGKILKKRQSRERRGSKFWRKLTARSTRHLSILTEGNISRDTIFIKMTRGSLPQFAENMSTLVDSRQK